MTDLSVPGVSATLDLTLPRCFNSSVPQPVFVTLLGANPLVELGSTLHFILQSPGVEFLGIKILSPVASYHAKALTPYEVGSKQWHSSIREITGKQAGLILLRGIKVGDVLKGKANLLLSQTPQEAIRLAHCFFKSQELFFDPENHTLKAYLPAKTISKEVSPRFTRKKQGFKRLC
eukprot:m.297786 g.297786  ORF g.297786 m.297786 type:complete len:176 (+) comp40776_c0_seq3:2563-3090(+)